MGLLSKVQPRNTYPSNGMACKPIGPAAAQRLAERSRQDPATDTTPGPKPVGLGPGKFACAWHSSCETAPVRLTNTSSTLCWAENVAFTKDRVLSTVMV